MSLASFWLSLIDLSPFQGSLAPKPTVLNRVCSARRILGYILTCHEPHCQIWSKMASTGVPNIVLHVLCSNLSSGGYFRPSKVSIGCFGQLFPRQNKTLPKKGYFPKQNWLKLCVCGLRNTFRIWTQKRFSGPTISLRRGLVGGTAWYCLDEEDCTYSHI